MPRAKHCAQNERIKRRYVHFLREAKGYSTASIDMAVAAIARFEAHSDYRPFQKFHVELARAFKRSLAEVSQSGKPLSAATVATTLRALKAFFLWLADQPGYRSAVRYSDAAYFSPTGQDERIASATRIRPGPDIAEIERVLIAMPATDEIQRRDRAIVAFIILTGARDRAVISFKLKHIDLERQTVFQDAREVRTKHAKSFTTCFFPVGDLAHKIVKEWIEYLSDHLKCTREDPLFPATQTALDINRQFTSSGLSRRHWTTASPVRKIFKDAFRRVGLPYHNPHSFRSTLARLGERLCRTSEEFKAWSQNFGHEGVMTTFSSYGKVAERRQHELVNAVGRSDSGEDKLASRIARIIRDELQP